MMKYCAFATLLLLTACATTRADRTPASVQDDYKAHVIQLFRSALGSEGGTCKLNLEASSTDFHVTGIYTVGDTVVGVDFRVPIQRLEIQQNIFVIQNGDLEAAFAEAKEKGPFLFTSPDSKDTLNFSVDPSSKHFTKLEFTMNDKRGHVYCN